MREVRKAVAGSASMMATTMADAAGMMYSIYVTSVIRYDSFVALASKNARTSPVAGSSSTIVRKPMSNHADDL